MGLGTKKERGVFLSIAGGYIWNRKADESDPDYAEQTYVKADKSEGVRTGAQYSDLTGMVTNVVFRTHSEWGENINVTFVDGDERFIVSISTNNRYSQDMMKFLLKADFSQPVFMKPYDFVDAKTKKRVQGLSFRQNGEKINLRNDDAPSHDPDWFKSATKKQIKRYFEDLTDWYVAEVEEKVCSQFEEEVAKAEETKKDTESANEEEKEVEEEKKQEVKREVKAETKQAVTPLRMKKFLRIYISENYDDKELPKLSKEDVLKWYNLALDDEELPFEDKLPKKESKNVESDVDEKDLDAQLAALMKK